MGRIDRCFSAMSRKKSFTPKRPGVFFRWAGRDPPRDVPTHIRELLQRLVEMNSAPRRPRLALPHNLDETVSEVLAPVAFGQNETQSELQPNHPYSLYATFIARECVFMTL